MVKTKNKTKQKQKRKIGCDAQFQTTKLPTYLIDSESRRNMENFIK